jgi:hypothetical protein
VVEEIVYLIYAIVAQATQILDGVGIQTIAQVNIIILRQKIDYIKVY